MDELVTKTDKEKNKNRKRKENTFSKDLIIAIRLLIKSLTMIFVIISLLT